MDRFFLRGLRMFKSISGFLSMLFLTHIQVLTAAGVQGAETIGASAPRVETAQGSVEGVWVDASKVFRGIPFAKPPVEGLRWQPPQPVDPLVRRATREDFWSRLSPTGAVQLHDSG